MYLRQMISIEFSFSYLFWSSGYLEVHYIVSKYLAIFQELFVLIYNLCSSQRAYILCMIWVLLNLTLVLWPRVWPVLVIILYALEKIMCFDVLGRVFSKCQSSKVGGKWCSRPLYPCWFSVLSLTERRVLKSPTIIDLFVTLCSSFSFGSMHFKMPPLS